MSAEAKTLIERGRAAERRTRTTLDSSVADVILELVEAVSSAEAVEYGSALICEPGEARPLKDLETALAEVAAWNESSARIKRMGGRTSGPAMLVERIPASPWRPSAAGER